MTGSDFDIKLLDLHWIKDVDDPTDLCAHGHVFVKIGGEVVADENSLDVTVSATALYLMRTIKNDYKPGDFASQLLPCCGHFIIADEDSSFVNICGCSNGIDWTITHADNNMIKHLSESGKEAIVDKDSYRKMVLDFADQVQHFYQTSLPKEIPMDDFDKKAYLTFWKEWRLLRDEWK